MIQTLLLVALLHHSFGAEYDVNKPITLTGTVTAIELTNPHTHFYIDVKGADGKVVNWKFEGYNPSVLMRNGFKRNVTMKIGDTITVSGWRARDGGAWAHSREITLADGSRMFFGPPAGTGDGGAQPAVEAR
jgi:hypothetical protein